MGKERRIFIGLWWPARQHMLLKLPRGLLLALCRRTLGRERHRYAIAWLNTLGTDPMAYGDITQWTPPRKSERIPWVSSRFSLSVENEQAHAGRDGRTRPARPISQVRTGTGKYSFSLFSWPRAGLSTLPGWSLPLLYVMTIHQSTKYSRVSLLMWSNGKPHFLP